MRLTLAVVTMAVAPAVLAQLPGTDELFRGEEWRRDHAYQLEELKRERQRAAEEAARSLRAPDTPPLPTEPLMPAVGLAQSPAAEPDWEPEELSAPGIETGTATGQFEYNRSRNTSVNPRSTW